MARVCCKCEYYEPEGTLEACPQCGGRMRFTLLGPMLGASPASLPVPAVSAQAGEIPSEVLEQSGPERMGQIGLGIGLFCMVRFSGSLLIDLDPGLWRHADQWNGQLALLLFVLLLYVFAAVLAGIIAGAWTVRWMQQGLGVAAGLLTVPVAIAYVLEPRTLIVSAVLGVVTAFLTIGGAFLGHVLIRPHRMLLS